MRASVSEDGDTVNISTEGVFDREPSGELCLPWRSTDGKGEVLVMGYRQNMLDLAHGGESIAEVSTGSGLGTDFIQFRFRDHSGVIRGRDLLLEFIRQVAPDEYEAVRASIYPAEEAGDMGKSDGLGG